MSLSAVDLRPTWGSYLRGFDPRRGMSAALIASLEQLLARRKLLVLHLGELTADQQIELMAVFGPVIVEDMNGLKWSRVSNLEFSYVPSSDKLLFHSDYQFTTHGPLELISLYAEVMELAEPTMFANMVDAVDRLPASLLAQVEKLNVVQLLDYSKKYSESKRSRLSNREADDPISQYPHCTQPMLQIHAGTGERYINVSQMMTSHVEGWSDAASDDLFLSLEQYIYHSGNIYTHDWEEGDLIIWDNRALQHGREALKEGARRSLRRVAVNSIDVPTLLRDVAPDPEKLPSYQYGNATSAI